MPIKFLIAAAAVVFSMESRAASFATGFEDPPYNAFNGPDVADLAGQDGWSINNSTPLISFIAERKGSQAGGIGGVYNGAEEGEVVTVRHDVGLPLSMTTFSVDFTISPFTDPDFSGQDAFGFSFSTSSAAPLFSLSFNPRDPQDGILSARYSILGGANIPSGYGVLYGGDYTLSIDFSPSGVNDVGFQATLSGTNTETFGGIIPGAGAESVGSVGAFYQVIDNSDSYMTFDNFAVAEESVPDGGATAALLGISLCGMIGLRKRLVKSGLV